MCATRSFNITLRFINSNLNVFSISIHRNGSMSYCGSFLNAFSCLHITSESLELKTMFALGRHQIFNSGHYQMAEIKTNTHTHTQYYTAHEEFSIGTANVIALLSCGPF